MIDSELQEAHQSLQSLRERANRNYTRERLYALAIGNNEGIRGSNGQLIIPGTTHQGRNSASRYIVEDEVTGDNVNWGAVNQGMSTDSFKAVQTDVISHMKGSSNVYIGDHSVGEHNPVAIQYCSENASHGLFANYLFLPQVEPGSKESRSPISIVHSPSFLFQPTKYGLKPDLNMIIAIDLESREVVIAGGDYSGETKKAAFTILNYLCPQKGILGMHCSANVGPDGDSSIFFGLSGTGKTTTSTTDEDRKLIGDDEIGWDKDGVFNFEGGSYAKVLNLTEMGPGAQPQIFRAANKPLTILENVAHDPHTGEVFWDQRGHNDTENTRAAYPLDFLENAHKVGYARHPAKIFFLMADAYGVFPAISILTPEQAIYYFLTGYTSKIAGTEDKVKNHEPTFSTGFGAPFLPLHPRVYAKLLEDKIRKHKPDVYLVNTGWTGSGERMPLEYTLAMIKAAQNETLDGVETKQEPFFGLNVPVSAGRKIPPEILDPRKSWAEPEDYDVAAKKLAYLIRENATNSGDFDGTSKNVIAAGPR